MEPGLIRLCAAAILVILFVGDFTFVINPVFRSLGFSDQDDAKSQTAKKPTSVHSSTVGHGANAKNSLNLLAATTAAKNDIMATVRDSCLPKLICELNAAPHRERLSEAEKSLLSLIRDTSLSMTAEVTSKYHFAAHMGQLIAGVDGTGCHNFYPACPFPGMKILQMMKKVKIR